MADEWEYIEQGDSEAAIVDILLNYSPELEFFNPLTVSTNLVGYGFGKRWVYVVGQGALQKWPPVIYRPRIDVEVFAERRSVAHDIALVCLASVQSQMGNYWGNGLFLSDATLEQGLTRVPDKYEEETRYIFSLRLTTRPHGVLSPPS